LQGVPPAPPPFKKADERLRLGERERKQAPILGGGDLRSKYNRLGLVGVTRITLWQRPTTSSCLGLAPAEGIEV